MLIQGFRLTHIGNLQDGEALQPTRRSARNATRAVKRYDELSPSGSEDGETESDGREGHPAKPFETPKQSSAALEWGASSPPFRQKRRTRGRRPGRLLTIHLHFREIRNLVSNC